MKKTLAATLGLSTLVLVTGCDQKPPAASAADQVQTTTPAATPAPTQAALDDALAVINGQPLSRMEFAAMLTEWQRKRPEASISSPQLQSQLFNEMINLILVSQDAEAKGVGKSEHVQAALRWVRTRVLAETMLAQHLKSNPVTDEDIKKAYDLRYGSAAQKEYKASHILLKSEDDAKAVIEELAKGADFAELAKQRSTGPSAPKGGDLGWFSPSDMVPPFAEAVASMEKGSVSKTPVKTDFGWHVIRLEDTRETAPPAFEAVEDELRSDLRQKVVSDYVASLRKDAEIKPVARPAAPTSQPAEAAPAPGDAAPQQEPKDEPPQEQKTGANE